MSSTQPTIIESSGLPALEADSFAGGETRHAVRQTPFGGVTPFARRNSGGSRATEAARLSLTPELLGRLLRYEPGTGKLYWLPRTVDLFVGIVRDDPDRVAQAWNTRWAGRECFTGTDGRGYHSGSLFGQTTRAHRVIWCLTHGYWPVGIDHIDGDKLNNRFSNLREASQAENVKNLSLRTANKIGVTGVRRHRRKFQAYIGVNGRSEQLGSFETLEEAIAARKEAELRHGFHANHGRQKEVSHAG